MCQAWTPTPSTFPKKIMYKEDTWALKGQNVAGSPQLEPGRCRIWTCGKWFCYKDGLFPVSGSQM